jgi:hypothetical protein
LPWLEPDDRAELSTPVTVVHPIPWKSALAASSLALQPGQTMLRLTARQRSMLIEKVPDVANLILASTFLGQLLMERPVSVLLATLGLGIWTTLAIIAFMVAGNE